MKAPLEIANFFIEKSLSTGRELTPMKLVKLVYISHGWHLGLTEKPLIAEAAQAWKYGPVIISVYHDFKKYGGRQITSLEPSLPSSRYYPIVTDTELVRFLNRIWDVYSKFSGGQLSTLTHKEGTPWDIVWNEKGGKKLENTVIPNELIRQHYKTKINERAALTTV